jgi:hypothetical protein
VAKVRLEAHATTINALNELGNPAVSAGAESGAVGVESADNPPAPLLAEVLALVRRLDPADRARLAAALQVGGAKVAAR